MSLRWDSYVLLKGESEIKTFCKNHLDQNKKILYVLGKGFDVRMNHGIKLLNNHSLIDIDCMLIEFLEDNDSSSNQYSSLSDENLKELRSLRNVKLTTNQINMWEDNRRIGSRRIVELFKKIEDLEEYSDIFIDISSLPRGLYFSLIGKLLSLIDKTMSKINLFVFVSENVKIDELIIEKDIDDDLSFTFGFSGKFELTSESDKSTIWFPILGEKKRHQIEKVFSKINPQEICPLLPFPSKDLRRSDSLLIEYYQLLVDELQIETQNLLYSPEQNPFEVYRNLSNSIINFNESLSIINGCKVAISSFSSKLLSIGALLTAYELSTHNKLNVAILNVDSKGYSISDIDEFKRQKSNSESFLIWLTGDPYA